MGKMLETLQQGSNIVELVLLDTDAVLYVQGIVFPVTPCTNGCDWECERSQAPNPAATCLRAAVVAIPTATFTTKPKRLARVLCPGFALLQTKVLVERNFR